MELGYFKTEDNRTYITVDLKIPKDKALTMANSHFKIGKDRIGCSYGWVRRGTLYFKEIPGAKKVWMFWRKTKGEK